MERPALKIFGTITPLSILTSSSLMWSNNVPFKLKQKCELLCRHSTDGPGIFPLRLRNVLTLLKTNCFCRYMIMLWQENDIVDVTLSDYGMLQEFFCFQLVWHWYCKLKCVLLLNECVIHSLNMVKSVSALMLQKCCSFNPSIYQRIFKKK